MMGRQLLRSFMARYDDGTEIEIDHFQDMVHVPSRDGSETIPGLQSLRLRDGRAVNRLEKGRYQIVETDEIVTSVTPDAP